MISFRAACLSSHVYWHKKAQFALDRDIYDRWTLFAVEEGRFAYRIGEQAGEAEFADLVLCPPQTWFAREVLEPLSFHFFHLDWQDSGATLEGGEPDKEPVWLGKGKSSLEDTQRVASTFRMLGANRGIDDGSMRIDKQHLLNDLLYQVYAEGVVRDRIVAEAKEEDPVMRAAMTCIMEQAFASISLRGLAHEIGITPVQLTRRFRAAYGRTPLDFLTDLRMRRASHLLEETSLSLERIAQQCGYENGFYLSRVFQKKRGTSPSLYRKRTQV